MSDEKESILQQALDINEQDPYEVADEDFFETTIDAIDKFDEKAWAKGKGYEAPNFPIFSEYMEGLDEGFFMFAGESNAGKSAVMLNILYDFATYEPNNLFGIYFSLDDTNNEIIPRLIAMNEMIPISVGAKPQRYQEIVDDRPTEDEGLIAADYLRKRQEGIQHLKDIRDRFKVVDGTTITCGEQILNYCIKLKSYIQAKNPDANIIVGIDSLSDMVFPSQNFGGSNRDKQLNDYIAKEVKRWAVEVLNCPIFGSLHLKKFEGTRRPAVSDVKESGRYIYEASLLFLVHNDVSKNRENATIFDRTEASEYKQPVIELDWAKNKKSSYKGITYYHFTTNYSKVTECSKEQMDRFRALSQSI